MASEVLDCLWIRQRKARARFCSYPPGRRFLAVHENAGGCNRHCADAGYSVDALVDPTSRSAGQVHQCFLLACARQQATVRCERESTRKVTTNIPAAAPRPQATANPKRGVRGIVADGCSVRQPTAVLAAAPGVPLRTLRNAAAVVSRETGGEEARVMKGVWAQLSARGTGERGSVSAAARGAGCVARAAASHW